MSCTTAWILSILSLTRSEITSRWDEIGFARRCKCNNSYCACLKSHSDHWLDLCLAICFNLILLRFVNSQVAASCQLRFLTIFFHFIMFIHYQSGVPEMASKLQSMTKLFQTLPKKRRFQFVPGVNSPIPSRYISPPLMNIVLFPLWNNYCEKPSSV